MHASIHWRPLATIHWKPLATIPARIPCSTVLLVCACRFCQFCAVSGHIWETHGSAGATVGVGYGTALGASGRNSLRVKTPSTQTTARACAWPPPCRPNSPCMHGPQQRRACIALPVAFQNPDGWMSPVPSRPAAAGPVTVGPRRRRRTLLSSPLLYQHARRCLRWKLSNAS